MKTFLSLSLWTFEWLLINISPFYDDDFGLDGIWKMRKSTRREINFYAGSVRRRWEKLFAKLSLEITKVIWSLWNKYFIHNVARLPLEFIIKRVRVVYAGMLNWKSHKRNIQEDMLQHAFIPLGEISEWCRALRRIYEVTSHESFCHDSLWLSANLVAWFQTIASKVDDPARRLAWPLRILNKKLHNNKRDKPVARDNKVLFYWRFEASSNDLR